MGVYVRYLFDEVEICLRNGLCALLFLICGVCLRLSRVHAVWAMGWVWVKVFEGCKGYWDVVDGRFRRWKEFDGGLVSVGRKFGHLLRLLTRVVKRIEVLPWVLLDGNFISC